MLHLVPREACLLDRGGLLLEAEGILHLPESDDQAQEVLKVQAARGVFNGVLEGLLKLTPRHRMAGEHWEEPVDEPPDFVDLRHGGSAPCAPLELRGEITHLLRCEAAVCTASGPGGFGQTVCDVREVRKVELVLRIQLQHDLAHREVRGILEVEAVKQLDHILPWNLTVPVGLRCKGPLHCEILQLPAHADELPRVRVVQLPRAGDVDLAEQVLPHLEGLRRSHIAQDLADVWPGNKSSVVGVAFREGRPDVRLVGATEALARAVDRHDPPEVPQVQVAHEGDLGLVRRALYGLHVGHVAQQAEDVLAGARAHPAVLVHCVACERLPDLLQLPLPHLPQAEEELAAAQLAAAVDVHLPVDPGGVGFAP
mmetsp:Transcript_18860/g.59240  ORF Transcript_18860/g.59240 Transcript_18860/m.59240 type:complete len:369 (-) Transcript_18860:921-2027(-)